MRLTAVRFMPGVTKNKIRRPRKYDTFYSNAWHVNSEVTAKDQGYRAACESKGIRVYSPEEIIRPYLPDMGLSETEKEEYQRNDPVVKAYEDPSEHPFYQDIPCKLFNDQSRLIKHAGLQQAKVLTNSVEIKEGLPDKLNKDISLANDFMSNGEEVMKNLLMEVRIFDATQKKLPKNVATPNINWNPVLDRMHRPLPYPDGDFSWGRKLARTYGIPSKRKNLSLVRGMMYTFDRLAVDVRDLLKRQHIEQALLRQYFNKDGFLVQINCQVPYMVTDETSLKPYAIVEDVEKTKSISLPDIKPLTSLSYFFDSNTYNDTDSFAIRQINPNLPLQHVHTCFEFNNFVHVGGRLVEDYHGRSLIMAFANCLAQARLKYGSEVDGVLPEPITVHFVNTDGFKFHFSAFQLNTLDLEGEVKNIFWHEPEMENMFEKCDYVTGKPRLEGYNHNVFKKLLSMYLQNSV